MHHEDIVLNEDQREELYEAFKLFEKGGKGKMSIKDVGELLRCIGWNPSETDLEEARNELDINGKGTVLFTDVETYVARRGGLSYGEVEEKDILEAFRVLDKSGEGKIDIKEFRHLMTTMGEKMTPEEVEEFVKVAQTDGLDFIDYQGILRAMELST